MANREACYNMIPLDYPIEITKVFCTLPDNTNSTVTKTDNMFFHRTKFGQTVI